MHDKEQGRLLIAHARASIERQLVQPVTALPRPDWLLMPGAVFVTLTRSGELRGCIGSLVAHRPLIDDLQANASAAAFRDPRFAPVTAVEWPEIRVEVSLLSKPEPIVFLDEADALHQLRPGIDGVIIEHGWHKATFLPQVWDQLPDARQFLGQLKRKAGLAPDFWAPDLGLQRYTVEKFKEEATQEQA